MSRRSTVFVIFTIGALGAATLALATQPQEQNQTTPGRFQVSSSGKFPILLDTATGETWVLTPSMAGAAVPNRARWLPLERVQEVYEGREWVDEEFKELRHMLDQDMSKKSVDTPWGALSWWAKPDR